MVSVLRFYIIPCDLEWSHPDLFPIISTMRERGWSHLDLSQNCTDEPRYEPTATVGLFGGWFATSILQSMVDTLRPKRGVS